MLPAEAQKTWNAARDHFQTFTNDGDEVLTTGYTPLGSPPTTLKSLSHRRSDTLTQTDVRNTR
jgi:hypothetical protein